MTYPRTSAELDWLSHSGSWAPAPDGVTRVLDLRPADADPVPATSLHAERFTHAHALWRWTELSDILAGGYDPEFDSRPPSTWALTLGRLPDGAHTPEQVIILFAAHSHHVATVVAAEMGLLLPVNNSGDMHSRHDHLDGVLTGLLDPDHWHPGLATADLRTDREQRAALYDLLHLAHPRIPTSAAARPFSILNQNISSGLLLEWASSPHPTSVILDVAAYTEADSIEDWLQHLPSDVLATWLAWGPWVPDYSATGIAVLHAAGWQPPTALRAWPHLNTPLDVNPTLDIIKRVAALSPALTPMQVTDALCAGLTLDEIETALATTGLDGFDWDALNMLAALRGPA